MRLDFNVLWVEDQQDRVQAQKVKLERLIRTEGFRLNVQFAVSVDQAKRYLGDDLYGDNVDLILMDYNLRGGVNGDVGLKEVRRVMPYKEMIFYSAAADDLRTIVSEARVEGIYLSNREALPETASGVFETLVKKVLDIDHSRGIAMGATSDIDEHVSECLVRMFDIIGEQSQAKALKYVHARLESIEKWHTKTASQIRGINHLSELLEHHALYSSNDRLRLLRKLLDANGLHSTSEDKERLLRYITDVVPARNVLAHCKVKVDGFSRKLFDRKGKEYTNDEMRRLRLELLENVALFERLSLRLSTPGGT